MYTVNLKVFAILKDYFAEEFSIEVAEMTIEGLKLALIQMNPETEIILKSSRFAINNTMVIGNVVLEPTATIYIIPPSSGG